MATFTDEGPVSQLSKLFANQLDRESLFHSKVIHKFNESHPDVVSTIYEKLGRTTPMVVKLPTRKAKELTSVDNITYLREALQTAVELEMTVMFEYLFACFSVINSSDEVNRDSDIAMIIGPYAPYLSELRREYKNQFMIICIQEMQHMCMACDMLISIGGIPNLQKVKFPSEIGVGKEKADLIRLNLESLYMFAKNEEPYPDESSHTQSMYIIQPEIEEDFEYISIAQLYGAISEGFKTIHQQIGNSMFYVKPGMSPMKKTYTDLNSCLKDIQTIQEQGEGELGGKLFDDIINQFLEWIENIKLPSGDKEIVELKKSIIKLCEYIKGDIGDLGQLIPETFKLIKMVEEFGRLTDIPLPFDKASFIKDQFSDPSHFLRFLMMILNYLMMMKKAKNEIKNDEFEAYFSRPSLPRPDNGEYHPTTKKIIDLTNTAYHVLLKILEATIIAVPSELDNSYQITQRYNNIRFYPIMSILIYPLGDILSYFQLSPGEKGKKLTAGFPFIPNPDDPYISDPLDKFHDVVLTLKRLHKQSLELDSQFFHNLESCVGMWIYDKAQPRQPIIDRVKYMLRHIIESIRVIYLGFTNGLSPNELIQEKLKTRSKPPNPKENVNKYYLNVEFDGHVIYSMASDSDPTFETRGFCGHHFMFEETQDPDFTDELHSQNTLKTKDGKNPFNREFIPDRFYKGVKCTSAKLVLPYYESEDTINKEKFDAIQKALQDDFKDKDFRFSPMEIDGHQCEFRFPQLNYAITRHIGIDPIFVGFETDQFDVQRANLLYDKNDKMVDFIAACLTCSDNFGAYPEIVDSRIPKSGGYLQWIDPFKVNNGLLKNTNRINAKSGAGQSASDFYTTYKRRCDMIQVEIDKILINYQDDTLANLINTFLENYPQSKLIVLALMVNIKATDINRLSYLCTRYLNCIELINANFIASQLQCFYHIPLNAPKDDKHDYFTARNIKAGDGGVLSGIEFFTDQDWYLDFWVGGMDYDALTLFMSGNLMVPVIVDLGKP